MFIVGLGTAMPPQRYSQRQCWDALQAAAIFPKLATRSQAILRKVLLSDNGIAARRLAVDPIAQIFDLTPDVLHARFVKTAPQLATEAAQRALEDSSCTAGEIDAVLISTCTGYLCPGLTSYVHEQLRLRPETLALDLVGQGCGAALPNLRTAEALLGTGRAKKVLSICVEVCSAAFYLDDDPGVLVSACLFGDGAGAAVLSSQPSTNRRRVEWKSAASRLMPAERNLLRFEQKGGMLRNILSPKVPPFAAKEAARLLDESLKTLALERPAITGWIFHAGGRDVLLALRETLRLSKTDVQYSAAILREFGNVSSPTVYFVLQAALNASAPGGLWWMSSFGAGFSCHGALLEVEQLR